MPDIQLTPAGNLRWIETESSDRDLLDPGVRDAFLLDWREGLFLLAARRPEAAAWPSLRYWQTFSEMYVAALCHVPAEMPDSVIQAPTAGQLDAWILGAPPLQGGEYLSAGLLVDIWHGLNDWVQHALRADGGLDRFMQQRAPKWRQVGRVWLHLAENRNDPELPFAFMATYTSGLGSGGRLKHLPLGTALQQYAGAKNRPALIRLLTPVQQAAARCPWMKRLVDNGQIYQPTAWSAQRAHGLLTSLPQLEECGLSVRVPDWWKARPRARVRVNIDRRDAVRMDTDAMLDFDVGVALGDRSLSAGEIEDLLAGDDGLVLLKGQWVEVDREKLQQALEHWRAVEKQARSGQISFIEGMRLLAGAPADLSLGPEIETEQVWMQVQAGSRLRELLAGLRNPGQLKTVDAGTALQATLRPYQREGVDWLRFLSGLGLGACLADDMGLGKTLQVLALMLSMRQGAAATQKPSLLVVPASLLGNWRSEAQRFAPTLKLQFLHPAECDADKLERIAGAPAAELQGVDLAVTTYSMLHRQAWLRDMGWHLVILDEAQAIKNAGTRQSKAVKQLSAHSRIALTGTPVENRLGDLWSLFDFLNPGLLGSASVFKSFVKQLEQREQVSYAPLRQLVSPYILRRMKTDRRVIADLPEKTETRCFCALSRTQARLYQQTVESMRVALASADGIARRGLVLQTLMRLKQICNHPSQRSGDGGYAAVDSGKFLRLAELCEELAERQERVLVFTQFREIIDPLVGHLAGVFQRPGLCLHGGTAVGARKAIVEHFQADGGPPFLVLSLKAGGTGLNLTAASQVIHFDRWWNPAVENQATDRAFRIGQKRPVLVHKFVTAGTIEERIDALIADKRKLADDILGADGEVNLTELADEQLLELVRLDVKRALM
ncbi:MAG: DEAD/DEAH box helicase [Rhodanobacter sp.]|nr:MAG: DEAD/DEAH box helicase [Rhodanobacter sp.]